MNKISLDNFISQWLPVQIKNKILFYLLKSPHSMNKYTLIPFFRFGEKTYNTQSNQNMGGFLPFRNEEFQKNIIIPKEPISDFIKFQKIMKSFICKMDTTNMKSNKYMEIVNVRGNMKTVESKYLGVNELKSIEYTNEMEIENLRCGLLRSEKEVIMTHYKPYNNGYSQRFLLYSDSNYKIISISPLQMLWRIRHGLVSVKEKKELATINQISGRSKLKTNDDYLKAFMKL